MKKLRLFAIASVAVAMGVPALAQSVDAAAPSSATVTRGAAVAPARTTHNSKAAKSVLKPFGPYITQTGVGAGGADVSELYTTVGYTTWGFGFQNALGLAVCDDFIVSGGPWTISTIKWLGYQTGATTAGSFNGLYLNVWTSDPLGQGPGGQAYTGGNQFVSQTWTGVYRLSDTALTNTQRAIIEVKANGGWLPALANGTYWLDASATGTLSSGPWAPPVVVAGQIPPTVPPYNARQFIPASSGGTNLWTALIDGGSGDTIDFLFQLEDASGGYTTACTANQKVTSAGCVPTLTLPIANVTKGAVGSVIAPMTNAQMPATPGMLIFAPVGNQAANATPYGELCMSPFFRASTTATTPTGSAPCGGTYNFDIQKLVNDAQPGQANVGAQLIVQAWFRDNGYAPPGNADFSNAVLTLVVQ